MASNAVGVKCILGLFIFVFQILFALSIRLRETASLISQGSSTRLLVLICWSCL